MPLPINFLAVFVSAVAGFVLGFLWHGPLFGKQWMTLSGISPTQAKEMAKKMKGGEMYKLMFLGFLAQVITAFVLANFAWMMGIGDVAGALLLALWSWLGFVVTTQLNGVLWEKRSVPLYLFGLSYYFCLFCLMSLIVVLWR